MTMRTSMTSLFLLLAVACGDTRDPDPGPDRDAGPTPIGVDAGPGGGEHWCCVNDAFYDCPSEAAVVQCGGGFDLDGCLAACPFDDFDCPPECFDRQAMTTPDPSACARDSARDGQCRSSCEEDPSAPTCSVDGDCASRNCTMGRCYPNTEGSLCTVDGDCDSSNCTGGCCRGNGIGERCTVDGDCDSSNCTDGECHGNGFGDRCTVDGDCDSRDCSDGRCR